ncbi:Protein NRT1/ PTR FAMILY 4.4 [Cucurbita argyrosperma subsp. argyrosperma]|nr:Protein NRT1/ PTR FAMILY 4.4 [Cucurbita argyrosperma subsp. argyrosperma]
MGDSLEKTKSILSVDTCVDWRGRPCNSNKHGGMGAAAFVLGLQAFEMMAIAAVGNNLITYVYSEMHFPLSKAANVVTNFVGTVFLLSLLGGFLSDSYLGSFRTMLIFGFIELSGKVRKRKPKEFASGGFELLQMVPEPDTKWCASENARPPRRGFTVLTVQAHYPGLRPAACKMGSSGEGDECEEAKGYKALMFFSALYLVALGSGCLKPNIISHGADQFQKQDPTQFKKLSTFFNCAYFAFCTGELIALTLLVWVQTHSGMDLGFGVSTAAMLLALISLLSGTSFFRNNPPRGSIFTPIAQVFVAAFTKRKQICPSNSEMLHGSHNGVVKLLHTDNFRFLDKACIKSEETRAGTREESPWKLCTVTQVEQVKIILSVIPIFACTIIFNTILAQLQTFSVQQGASMNTTLTNSFQIPPASLQSIPYLILIFLVPLYETAFVPLARRLTATDSGITPLQRVGTGLFVATFSMVSAALVEQKRRHSSNLSILWIAPQFVIFGISELFTAVGLVEFFYKQSVEGMQSFLTAMTYCSYSFGFYLSSLLVSVVNKVSGGGSGGGWLSHNDLNKDRLDLFYWLLAGLSLVNFFNYLFWANRYSQLVAP